MNDISIGAVGAAIVAGLVSIIGLIIGKEQKISEFRQSWIDELRKCFVSYLVSINSISDALRAQNPGAAGDHATLLANYKTLNEANHGIIFRINTSECTAKDLVKVMEKFEAIAKTNASLTPDKIKSIEGEFIEAAKKLLKFEWKRVKRGEKIFVWTKNVVIALVVALMILLVYISLNGKNMTGNLSINPKMYLLNY